MGWPMGPGPGFVHTPNATRPQYAHRESVQACHLFYFTDVAGNFTCFMFQEQSITTFKPKYREKVKFVFEVEIGRFLLSITGNEDR